MSTCVKCKDKAFLVLRDPRVMSGYLDIRLCFDCALVEIQKRKAEGNTPAPIRDAYPTSGGE